MCTKQRGRRRVGLTALRTLQSADLQGGDFGVVLPDPQVQSRLPCLEGERQAEAQSRKVTQSRVVRVSGFVCKEPLMLGEGRLGGRLQVV